MCLRHASRTVLFTGQWRTGEYKVRTYLQAGHSSEKSEVIPYNISGLKMPLGASLEEWRAGYQLVGEVKAHQGYDGYRLLAESPAQWD